VLFSLNLLFLFFISAIAPLAGQISKDNPEPGYFIEAGGENNYYLGIN